MKKFAKDQLRVEIYDSRKEMGKAAGKDFSAAVKELFKVKDTIRVVFAAAPSQNETLEAIAEDQTIDFSRIIGFHMDEYVDLDADAPQGFGNFLRRAIFSRRNFKEVHYLDGNSSDHEEACRKYAEKLAEAPIDIVVMGIGENGHIAFNDPEVADFNDPKDVKIVGLDDICRNQQVHDGCFAKVEDVPTHAMTLTVPRLSRATYHFCVVPASTKANAVFRMLNGDINEECPATILRTIPKSVLYLDPDSSAIL
jgi:glucosamine-6-phosphate deaminase